ncbi:MAG: hypothetical protein NTV52_02245 [Acidobacteria bacterium]|nr:hypothetical protein [Acidobacteriota bacterium]
MILQLSNSGDGGVGLFGRGGIYAVPGSETESLAFSRTTRRCL